MKLNIAAVIVTFNRKELLIKCIEAVIGQTFLPQTIIIIDNASTDGTEELLRKKGFCDGSVNGITLYYERLSKNSGGAGGFYFGIKRAQEASYDAVWVMDDDGLPDKDCLKNMISYLGKYDYISPLVVDIKL